MARRAGGPQRHPTPHSAQAGRQLARQGRPTQQFRASVEPARHGTPLQERAFVTFGRIINHHILFDGAQHPDLINGFGIYRRRVSREHHKICQLPHLERAFAVFLKMLPRRPDRHRL